MSRRERKSRSVSAPELLLSPLVRFFERRDRKLAKPVSSLGDNPTDSAPLKAFFQDMLTKNNGTRPQNFILISDRARNPHNSLLSQVGDRQPNHKKRTRLSRRQFVRKSLSTSSLRGQPDLNPANLLKDRWSSVPSPTETDPRWAPSVMGAAVVTTCNRRGTDMAETETENQHVVSEISPISVTNVAQHHRRPPSAPMMSRDPKPSLPQRLPSPRVRESVRTLKEVSLPPPVPPLFKMTKPDNMSAEKKKQVFRCESDSSLVCPLQTGRTIQSSRPCYRVTWVKGCKKLTCIQPIRPVTSLAK